MPHPEPKAYSATDLRVGLAAEFERDITEADILAFAQYTGDWNPLHVTESYAKSTKVGGRVVHGAYQVALASAIAGMHLPGRNCLVVSCHAQFQRPLPFPCRVAVRGEIAAWDALSARGSLRVVVSELPSGVTASLTNITFTLHEARPAVVAAPAAKVAAVVKDMAILVTGASGGIGSALVAGLSNEHQVLALVNRNPLPASFSEGPNVSQFGLDLSLPGWVQELEEELGDRPLGGIVHAAWPGMEHGGLLNVSRSVLEQQLAFATLHTIELARLLMKRAPERGGRFVVLGSTAGTRKPLLSTAAYSLAQAALEQTVILLAPELALRQITVNAVCPSFVPIGINRQASERQKLAVKASVPLGRTCTTDDILGAVRYLFSPEASFVSGQMVVLSGGQI
jgi:3-hydroxybutyryl-CoA dehydratase